MPGLGLLVNLDSTGIMYKVQIAEYVRDGISGKFTGLNKFTAEGYWTFVKA